MKWWKIALIISAGWFVLVFITLFIVLGFFTGNPAPISKQSDALAAAFGNAFAVGLIPIWLLTYLLRKK